MLHLRSYVGSIVLAGLLLQGCGGSSESTPTAVVDAPKSATVKKFDATTEVLASAFSSTTISAATKEQVLSDLTVKIASLDNTDSGVNAYVNTVIAENAEVITRLDAYKAIAEALTTDSSSSQTGIQTAGLFSKITDKVKDGLVKVLDTSVGQKITGAAFDVVLNSGTVTVVMLDAARKSETMAQIMVDSLDANWDLTGKMCPMLREDTEFGEKFTALAEERAIIGQFFFERIDARMYGCLTDAMLLSNNDAVHDKDVSHSTNAYMGILMDRYATNYFITPETGNVNRETRRNDNFVSLFIDNGSEPVVYTQRVRDENGTVTQEATFTGHGDGNELINEKFFYSLFKTPGTTDSFVAAMQQVDTDTRTMLMDSIFLGQPQDTTADADTVQGYLNIISIGSAMYDGIYGVKGADNTRTGAYGFGSYTGAFIGFAGLIPVNRYMTYGRAFMNAGYEYAAFHGIDVWTTVQDTALAAWDSYTAPEETLTANEAPARSAGLGLTGSDWYDDVLDLMINAWSNVSITGITSAALDSDKSIYTEATDQASIAYGTFVDGKNSNGVQEYNTTITNPLTVENDSVGGIHGLIELAMQEDIFYVNCGTQATDYYLGGYTCENNTSYTMDHAKAAFTLPAFSDLTMSFAYNTAYDGAAAYISNIDANWFADLSSNDLVREYFYPSADNIYIPSWMLAIDWLATPAAYAGSELEATDFDFNAGYFDIYVTSTNDALFTDTIDASALTNIEITKIDMNSDSIIAVDAEGKNLAGLNVYKIRAVSPEDVDAILALLSGYADSALTAVGIDSSNASDVDTTGTAAN